MSPVSHCPGEGASIWRAMDVLPFVNVILASAQARHNGAWATPTRARFSIRATQYLLSRVL